MTTNGKTVRAYLDAVIAEIDEGRKPIRRAAGWVRQLALPFAVSLSFGLGGCMVAGPQPGQEGGGDYGRADGFGETCPGPAEVCDDGVDNDRDGFFDCGDFDCLDDAACASVVLYAAPSEQDCGNGADDDLDGATDCADPDCNDNCLCEGQEPAPYETHETACSNETDDDSDGAADCDDPDCADDPACQAPSGGCGAVGVLCPEGSECVEGVCVPSASDDLCTDTCPYSGDGYCDDGGPGSSYDVCALGTDCADCGPR